MHQPRDVYITTPVLNGERFLEQALHSVLTQSGSFRIHYHVQDGGSTDGTLDLLSDIQQKLDEKLWPIFCEDIDLTFSSCPDGGMYDAIRRGFESFDMSADMPMTWLNADDLLLPNSFATVVALLSENPDVDWVTGARRVIDEVGSVVLFEQSAYPRDLLAQGLCESGSYAELQQEGTFWRKRLWDAVGGVDPRFQLAGDWDLWRRFARHSELLHVPYALGSFRRHADQKTSAASNYYTEIDKAIPSDQRAVRLSKLEPRLPDLPVKWLSAGETVKEECALFHLPIAFSRRRDGPSVPGVPASSLQKTARQQRSPQSASIAHRPGSLLRTTLAHIQTVNALKHAHISLNKAQDNLSSLINSHALKIGRGATYPLRLLRGDRQRYSPEEGESGELPVAMVPMSVGIDLGDQLGQFYGIHRSGWGYVVDQLAKLQNSDAIYLDTFIERTFAWHPSGPKKNLKPWIGFIHVPPNVPVWFHQDLSNKEILASEEWKDSLTYCQGLFTLSEYHKQEIERLVDLPVNSLLHPTEFTTRTWSWEAFRGNKQKKLIQVGWWLRKLNAIFEVPPLSYQKVLLRVTKQNYVSDLVEHERNLHREAGIFQDSMLSTVEVVEHLENEHYDQLLAENVVFIDLYDSSANNTVIECIARCTPLLVNPLPAVKEYLGEDYPLYYSTYDEVVAKAEDFALVRSAHDYLRSLSTRGKLTSDYFVESFINSEVYQNHCAAQ